MTWYEKIDSDYDRFEWTLSTAFLSVMCVVFASGEQIECQLHSKLNLNVHEYQNYQHCYIASPLFATMYMFEKFEPSIK